ncbi:hypothetical protein Pan216_56630 [Planctomycetes bacterium Pan216]|uniref:Uncharacterized protein n=1 Tax=Kolteria novifilia TaxID=2527975 RepID=A0A518BCQ6_9BACT|nr:hypothetical protein Pan216_56630 [Planctomycetes bacterium Pan216]
MTLWSNFIDFLRPFDELEPEETNKVDEDLESNDP